MNCALHLEGVGVLLEAGDLAVADAPDVDELGIDGAFRELYVQLGIMEVSFDPAKDAENIAKHGISLARAKEFDFDTAYYDDDDSQDYGEIRVIAVSWLDALLYTLVFRDEAAPNTIRAISLRKSNTQERKEYAQN